MKNAARINTTDFNMFRTVCDRADQLSSCDIAQLTHLLSYHFKDNIPFKINAILDRLYIYRVFYGECLIASRQIQIINNRDLVTVPNWVRRMAFALSVDAFAIGSRAIVHPDYRKLGIGASLINVANQDIFTNHNVPTIFGYTTSLGALSLHLQLGAGVWRKNIENLPVTASPDRKYGILQQLLSVKQFRQLPFKYEIRYVYRKNPIPKDWSCYLWYNDYHRLGNFGGLQKYQYRRKVVCDLNMITANKSSSGKSPINSPVELGLAKGVSTQTNRL